MKEKEIKKENGKWMKQKWKYGQKNVETERKETNQKKVQNEKRRGNKKKTNKQKNTGNKRNEDYRPRLSTAFKISFQTLNINLLWVPTFDIGRNDAIAV